MEDKKPEEKIEEKKDIREVKMKEEKKIEGKKVEQEKKVVGTATVRGKDLAISTKQSIAICDLIRGKEPDYAIELLERVLNKEKAVPMKGEIPHRRKGLLPRGKAAGRFPVNASKEFIKLLKNLIANASVKGMDADDLIISLAKADKASKPLRATRMAFGRKRFKRTHVLLEAKTKSAKAKQIKK